MKEINYQFRQRFSVVHRTDRRDMDKKCPEGSVEVNGDWIITVPGDADAVIYLLSLFSFQGTFFLSELTLTKMVGLSGLEPPTSRLSGGRSNRLSYKPICLVAGD